MTSAHEPVVCTLTTKDAAGQLLEWSDLRSHATRIEGLPAGARMRLPIAMEPMVEDLVQREAACCRFLDITTTRDEQELIIEVTSQNPDAQPVIALLAGLP